MTTCVFHKHKTNTHVVMGSVPDTNTHVVMGSVPDRGHFSDLFSPHEHLSIISLNLIKNVRS